MPSPERQRSAFSSVPSLHTSARIAPRTNEIVVLSRERERLNSTVEMLQRNLRQASEEHNEHLQQYEEEMQHRRARLDEAIDDRRQMEIIANEAMSTQVSHREEVSMFKAEREELRLTVDSLRDDMRKLTVAHDS